MDAYNCRAYTLNKDPENYRVCHWTNNGSFVKDPQFLYYQADIRVINLDLIFMMIAEKLWIFYK